MSKCEFQLGETCQIYALKNAVELALRKAGVNGFSKKEKFKFKKLEQLIVNARQCNALQEYFYSNELENASGEEAREKYNKFSENKKLPTYVAIFARAFPHFFRKKYDEVVKITFNYKMLSLTQYDKDYIFDRIVDDTQQEKSHVLNLKHAFLGFSEEMQLYDGKALVFGSSADIESIIRPFTAVRTITGNTSGHAVAVERSNIFNNSEINVNNDELLWYYNLLRVALLSSALGSYDKELMEEESQRVLEHLDMKEDDTRLEVGNVTQKEFEIKTSILNLLRYGDTYGYFTILDTNDTLRRLGKTPSCRWILPFEQFQIVEGVLEVTPISSDKAFYSTENIIPFRYQREDFLNLRGENTLLLAEQKIYNTADNLTEADIDKILSEGYVEWNYYLDGQKILEEDIVKLNGSEIEWEVWSLNEDEEFIIIIDAERYEERKKVENKDISLIYDEDDEDDEADENKDQEVESIPTKKQKLKLKF